MEFSSPRSAPDHAIEWEWSSFADLKATDVYAVLALRQTVFVVEQRCIFADIDWLDQTAWHLLGWQAGDGGRMLVAYLRVLPPGLKFTECSIGRVLTAPAVRGTGVGRMLVTEGLQRVRALDGMAPIRISAQMQLEKFYASFGFETTSAPYDEDNILHVDMLRQGGGRLSDEPVVPSLS